MLCWVVGYLYAVGFPLKVNSSDTPLWEAVSKNLPSKESTYLIGLLLTTGGAFLLHRATMPWDSSARRLSSPYYSIYFL